MANGAREIVGPALRHTCDPGLFEFETTAELSDLDQVIGQERALRAVAFGIDIKSEGYHMYALGPVGTGKRTTLKKFLVHDAVGRPVPNDWLYVNNFNDPDRPRALRMPAGRGRQFRDDMDHLVEELGTEVPQAFESKEYQQEQQELEQEIQRTIQGRLQNLERTVRQRGFSLLQTPQGLMLLPVINDELVTPDELHRLPDRHREHIEQEQASLEGETREAMRIIQQLQKEARERARDLDRRVIGFAVDHLIQEIKQKYADLPNVSAYLDEASAFLLRNVHTFKQIKQLEQIPPQQQMMIAGLPGGERPSFDEYRVNLVVDNGGTTGAPIVEEPNPSGSNLVGRIEHQGQFGALVTNFRLIKAGALHRANGGYLMIDVIDLLTKPLAWEVLKRALKNKEVVIESMMEAVSLLATRTLQPEPIPLDVKVILSGDPSLYYLLYHRDPEFQELFKVKAEFESRTNWTDDASKQYARFVATTCREEGLRHFDRSGVARLLEHAARTADHRERLMTRFGDLTDLIRQASYWAGVAGSEVVRARDVRRALDEQIHRANRIEDQIREMIAEGTLLIDSEGMRVGQINGLGVLSLGDYAFGKPSRISARTFVGTEGLINIDREAKLGGPIHNKGAMILAGFLGGRFAQGQPLSISGTVTFEQLYDGVEGDSASSAELYALLSSLSGYPLRQDLAVTGSVNQQGEVQAIGGVNEKVEGFFRTCKVRGLIGTQGVMIPEANERHLMLHEEVAEAVERGEFHIYSVATIDQGIELLSGRPAGQRDADGNYPEGSINAAVKKRLGDLAETSRRFHHTNGD